MANKYGKPVTNYITIGDSQAGLANSAQSVTSYEYNASNGVLRLNIPAHTCTNKSYIGFQVRALPEWNNYEAQVTVIDANNLSIQAHPGMKPFTVTDARWFKFGTLNGGGVPGWLQKHTNGKLRFLGARGVTGETMQQIVARINSEALTVLKPGDLLIINGGHNDLVITSNTAQQIFDTLCIGLDDAIDYGLNVIVVNMTPFGATYAPNLPAARARMCEFNRLCNRLPSIYPNLKVVDAYSLAVDATLTTLTGTSGAGTAKANWTASDLLHYSPITANAIALECKKAIDVWYPDINRLMTSGFDAYDATNNPTSSNLMQNAGFTTTTGGGLSNGITGVMPAQMTAATDSASGSSMVASVQQSSWGWAGNSVRIAWAVPITFNNARLRFISASQAARFVPGEKFICRCYFKTKNLASLINYFFYQINMTVDGNALTVAAALNYLLNSVQYYPNTGEYDGYLESAIQRIPDGVNVTVVQWEVGLLLSGTSGSDCNIELGQPSLERVII